MSTLMTGRIEECAIGLHNQYLELRNDTVPFPPESVAFWCYILALQNVSGVSGDLLELGVQHGGTAFLSSLSVDVGEKQFLVDLEKSDLFAEKFSLLPNDIADRVSFIEASTQSDETSSLLARSYRLIHIDAGHSYEAVRQDMERYAHLVQPDGIVCCDDFFTNRWPDVTMAVLDTYERAGLLMVALVNRKAYFAKAQSHAEISALLRDNLDALAQFGTTRAIQVHLRGVALWNIQISTKHAVSKLVI